MDTHVCLRKLNSTYALSEEYKNKVKVNNYNNINTLNEYHSKSSNILYIFFSNSYLLTNGNLLRIIENGNDGI